jgi:hypothetical protein
MRELPFILLFSLLLTACNNSSTTEATTSTTATDLSKYPEALQRVFDQHGGLVTWQKMQALSYEIVDAEGNEKQYIHLKDRRERIEAPNFVTGYDGQDIWVEADTSTYKGNPVFYHNLMFYFYAMPFVLADEGIVYREADPLTFEGKTYPGIKIAYEEGIGTSPKDEYFLYYDPVSYQMAWLGYTVTYFSNEKSQRIRWIKYDDWKTYNGLLLPNSISWYQEEGGLPTTPRNTAEFVNVTISETPLEDRVFAKTPGAKIVD